MDSKDRQILRELQADGRLTNQDLSERVNLSPSPCLRRVRLMEEQGVIRGYTALVDQKAWGLPVTVFIRIKLERHGDEYDPFVGQRMAAGANIDDAEQQQRRQQAASGHQLAIISPGRTQERPQDSQTQRQGGETAEEQRQGGDNQQPGKIEEILRPERQAEDVELASRQIQQDGLVTIPGQPGDPIKKSQ